MWRLAAACLTVLVAAPVSAQQLALDIRDGLVTLDANNAPVRQILAEWAKVGGTKVVGADRIASAPLTLRLEGVPEAKALAIVLRGAAGYMAATRSVPGTGRSTYDRILVLATSTPPAGGAGPVAAGGTRAPNRFAPPPPIDPPDSSDIGADTPTDVPQVNPFANAFGQPGQQPGFGQPQANPFAPPAQNPFAQPAQNPFGQPQANPFGQPVPNPFGQPVTGQGGSLFTPVPQGGPAGGLFGPGSSVPGVVQQPVDPQTNRPRPPGR